MTPAAAWLAVAALLPAAALAQAPRPAPTRAPARAELGRLLDALHAAPDEDAAGRLEQQIEAAWAHMPSPAAGLLIARGARDLTADVPGEAVDDFSDALALEPGQAEIWRRRAEARFAGGDYPGAVADLREALAQEPRDYAALRTLSRIAEARQDWPGALAAWQRLLQIDPQTPGGADRLKQLQEKAAGEQS